MGPVDYEEPFDADEWVRVKGLQLRRWFKYLLFYAVVARIGWYGFINHPRHDSFFFGEWPWLQGYVDSAAHQAFGSWLWWVAISIIGVWVFYEYVLEKFVIGTSLLMAPRSGPGMADPVYGFIVVGILGTVGILVYLMWEGYVAAFPSLPGWPTPTMGLELLLAFGALIVVGLWFCLLGFWFGVAFVAFWVWQFIVFVASWVWHMVVSLLFWLWGFVVAIGAAVMSLFTA